MFTEATVSHRFPMGTRLIVVFLGMAALPGWTLGQTKPEPDLKPIEEGIEVQFDPHELLKIMLQDELKEAFAIYVDELRVYEEKRKHEPNVMLDIRTKMEELQKKLAELQSSKALSEASETEKTMTGPMIKFGKHESRNKVRFISSGGRDIQKTSLSERGQALAEQVELLAVRIGKGRDPVITMLQALSDLDKAMPGPWHIQFGDGKDAGHGVIIFGDDINTKKAQNATEKAANSRAATKAIALVRCTYLISNAKAAALEAFLKEHLKATILETKMDAEGLTVTTTPETQKAVQSLIELMSGPRQSALQLDIQPKVKP